MWTEKGIYLQETIASPHTWMQRNSLQYTWKNTQTHGTGG